MTSGKKFELEKLIALSFVLYYTSISMVETLEIIIKFFTKSNEFIIWHDLLGHLSFNMMYKIIDSLDGHSLKNHKILQFKEFSYATCCEGKFITTPSIINVDIESPNFLERIQGEG